LLACDDDGFVSLLLPNGETKDDLRLPEGELGEQIKRMLDEGKDVTVGVISAMNEEGIVSVKETPKNI
jgi:translation initiation factor 5A